jgi:hypothetical protein
MNKLALTIIFDANYVEPGLVTACDLARSIPSDFDLILVFIKSSEESINLEISQLIGEVILQYAGVKNINAISLNSSLFENFNRYHFTNSILYKLLLPQIVEYYYILNIDAGFLSGDRIGILYENCRKVMDSHEFENAAVGAVCTPANVDLPVELRRHSHSLLYPAGGIFLFNVEAYRRINLFDRLISKYHTFKDGLIWAEQDLLCLTAREGELLNLNFEEPILIEQLSIQGCWDAAPSQAETALFMLYKITGTLKPWKYWVLDPKKKFYLKRRNEVLSGLDLNKYSVVKENRLKITHQPLYQAFLEVNEMQLTLTSR